MQIMNELELSKKLTRGKRMDINKLLDLTIEKGISVTRDQLWDYQREGLIPKPKVKGLGRGKGKTSEYPDETIDILYQICEFRKQGIWKYNELAWMFQPA